MFCGDHVMPHISPNVSYFPGIDEDPLHSFLSSLEELKKLPVKLAYPGHREPFTNWKERIDQLLHHHQQRLQWFLDFLVEPCTAWQCCQRLFGNQLSIHQLRFALSETLAHLIFLEKQGKIKRDGDQIQTYQGVSR
jgi:glyoxylase-like metal-dependent hydrolase (beta-lactamase superfamily II)